MWVNLRVTLGFVWHMEVTLTSFWGHLGDINVEWHAWMRVVAGLLVSLSAPRRFINSKKHIFAKDFEGS